MHGESSSSGTSSSSDDEMILPPDLRQKLLSGSSNQTFSNVFNESQVKESHLQRVLAPAPASPASAATELTKLKEETAMELLVTPPPSVRKPQLKPKLKSVVSELRNSNPRGRKRKLLYISQQFQVKES